MKKIIFIVFVFMICVDCAAQLRYKEGTKIYIDAGVQVIHEFHGLKIGGGRRINDILSVGVVMTKPVFQDLLSIGLEAKISTRRHSRRAGFLLHGAYYKSVIKPDKYELFDFYEYGFGGVVDDFSFSVGIKTYLRRGTEFLEESYAMFQLMHHFGSLAPQYKGLNNPNYSRDALAIKKAKKSKRLNGPTFLDVSLGKSILLANIYRTSVDIESDFSIGLGFQKNPWLGFGLNYSVHGSRYGNKLKSLGISWRARPSKGFYKITFNVNNQFEFEDWYEQRNLLVFQSVNKTSMPFGVSLEAGIRVFEILLLKAGCSYYLPHSVDLLEVREESSTFFIRTETVIEKKLYLGYFHVGFGFVL